MSNPHCCKDVPGEVNCKSIEVQGGAAKKKSPISRHRSIVFIKWITPWIALGIIPKCPLCLAGYIALATGIGISLAAAAVLRIFLMALCIGWLVYLANRSLHRLKH